MHVFEDNTKSIGRTPLVRINRLDAGGGATILAKIEGRNPAYSVKCRIGAAMVVLTSLDGDVIAASGLHVKAGTPFLMPPVQRGSMADDSATSVMVDNGRIYQLVTVSVRSPLPVAWIAVGFELDGKAARELADITGLAVTLSVNSGGHWTDVVSTMPAGPSHGSMCVA